MARSAGSSASTRRRGAWKGFLLAIVILAALIGVGVGYVRPWYAGRQHMTSETPVELLIARGDSLASAARKLEKAGLVSSADRFRRLARLLGSAAPIKAGEYGFYRSESWEKHLRTLQSGIPIQRFVAIPEGMPSILVAERLMHEPLLTGTIPVPAEGSILPDSYSFERGESRAVVVRRMQAAMTATLDTLWAARKPGIAVKSEAEAVNLAAIVEKETGVSSERRMVAGVYSNRLRMGMPLQADPTVIYPITRGKPIGRRILRSELQADNGYNTYARAGLPDGPIANPGRLSIAAVLNPEPTQALYFVANGTGGHVFANTLAEHNANVQKWYALRRQRGEM